MEILLVLTQYVLTLTPQQLVAGYAGLTAFLAWLFQVFGWVKASKVVGTFAPVDAGRVQRVLERLWPIVTKYLRDWVDQKKTLVSLYLLSQ